MKAKNDKGGGSSTVAPVERDATGRVVKGALNPGGLSKEQRLVRDLMQAWLTGDDMLERFKVGYGKAIDEGQPAILKDAADRLMGKVKETIEHKGLESGPGITFNELLQALAVKGGNDAG